LRWINQGGVALDQGQGPVFAPMMILLRLCNRDLGDALMKCAVALALTVALACAAGSVRAQDAGNPLKGESFAREVCAECHAVQRGQRRSPNAQAPAFEEIATTPGMTSIALTAALRTSHRLMPNIVLSDDELKNVVAYLLSMKQP
jgi:mono/diheme cytochrome c family protein